jgi:hypothetical protein
MYADVLFFENAVDSKTIFSSDTTIFQTLNTQQRATQIVEIKTRWFIDEENIPKTAKYKLLIDGLPIEVFKTDEGYCAVYEPLAEIDNSDSQEDAISNLWLKLEDYYDALQERKGRLSLALESELRHLETIMGK